MPGQTIIRGKVISENDPAGNPLEHGPLYLKPDDGGEPLLLVQAQMSAQAPVDHLAMQSRPAFEPMLGKTVEITGYQSGHVLYDAFIVVPDNAMRNSPLKQK